MNSLKSKKFETGLLFIKLSRESRNQKGVILVLVALLLVVLFGFVALAVDVGFYMVARNELQNIADGAALAACGELGAIYQNMSHQDQQDYICENPDSIIEKAVQVGANNRAVGLEGVVIEARDVIIGKWNLPENRDELTPTPNQPDGVRVIVRRDGKANSQVSTFFARALGIDAFQNLEREATAALTGQSTTEPGELELPVGISSYFFLDGNFCNDFIVFSPTNDPDSCAGWNSYDISPPNDNLLRSILNGGVTSPETTADETVFNFIGGNLSNPTFDALLLLFMRRGYDTQADGVTPAQTDQNGDPVTGPLPDGTLNTDPLYEDGERAYYPDDNQNPTPRNRHRWETTVVVYDRDDCSNPNTSILIKGYAKIAMTNVQNAPEKRIEGKIMCDLFSDFQTRGGGGEFGVKGTIPGLVK
jgi:hypothetical protein